MLIPHFGPLFRLSAETKARACVGGAARSRKSNPLIGTRNGFLFLPIGSPSDLTFPAQESRRETRAIARDSTRPIIQDRTECDVRIFPRFAVAPAVTWRPGAGDNYHFAFFPLAFCATEIGSGIPVVPRGDTARE